MTAMLYSMMISIIFPIMKHPLSMGLMLILQTLTVAFTTGLLINNFWFSYILVITMLSGMLVLFIYMASIASNEKFQSSINTSYIILGATLVAPIIFFLVDQLGKKSMWSTSKKMSMSNEHILNLMKLFNMHNMSITIMAISYLFLTMIVVSYIVNVFEGPLRSKN